MHGIRAGEDSGQGYCERHKLPKAIHIGVRGEIRRKEAKDRRASGPKGRRHLGSEFSEGGRYDATRGSMRPMGDFTEGRYDAANESFP